MNSLQRLRPLLLSVIAGVCFLFGVNSLALAEELPSEPVVTTVASVSAAFPMAPAGGELPPIWLVIPFVALLLMIAMGPLFFAHHWHHHYPKWAVGWGLVTSAYYAFIQHTGIPVLHAFEEYFAFIALLASLYVAAGGILIQVNKEGTPLVNVILLLVGAVLSNFIGTTGASMLLIRPFIRLNRGRIKPYHIIFFIFLVSNVGGALTPIGDPPLFLGFLRGVPFFWTLGQVWFIWLPTLLVLAAIFYVFDSRNKESSNTEIEEGWTIKISGAKNFVWLGLVIVLVFVDPNVFAWVPRLHFGSIHLPFGIREVLMFGVCYGAYRYADQTCLRGNEFNFEPIREVGWLFIGIFLTMQPALALISHYSQIYAESLTVSTFYWGTGGLSGILDNAPTYVSFLSAAMGRFGMDVGTVSDVAAFANNVGPDGVTTSVYLLAISVASVFFGAMTYIGNGPNFMVKAISESQGVDCPEFFGYVIKYSLPILLPTYFVVWAIFFSGWVF